MRSLARRLVLCTIPLAPTLLSACAESEHDPEGTTGVASSSADTSSSSSQGGGTTSAGSTDVGSSNSGHDASTTMTSGGVSGTSPGSEASDATESGTDSTATSEDNGEASETLETSTTESEDTGTDAELESGDTDSTTTGIDPSLDPNTDLLYELAQEICAWGFGCCETGELTYILGPGINTVGECAQHIANELVNNDNSAEEDEHALSLLGNQFHDLAFNLAYRVRLDRSQSIRSGLEACIAAWTNESCRAPRALAEGSCTEQTISRACQLDRLFEGKGEKDQFCDADLRRPFTDIECGPGLRCDSGSGLPDDPQNFRCEIISKLGDYCSWSTDTLDENCEYGTYCHRNTGVCTPRAGLGETCAYTNSEQPVVGEMRVPCEHGLYCDPLSRKCVDACSEGYACGPRLKANRRIERMTFGPLLVDNRLLKYPTPGNSAPRDIDDRCAEGLRCMPTRHREQGDTEAAKPGDNGYYFGRGDDFFGTSYECRQPRGTDGLCDTDGDCRDGLYCEHIAPTSTRSRVSVEDPDPHQHDLGSEGFYADLGTCRPRLESGAQCASPLGVTTPGNPTNDLHPSVDLAANLARIRDARCPQGHFCDTRSGKVGMANDRFTGGQCQPKLAPNAFCERHDQCDPERTLGLCVATDDHGDGNHDDRNRKRCLTAAIDEGFLCAPRSGLGTEVPFPIQLSHAAGSGNTRALTADFWAHGGGPAHASFPAELLPQKAEQFPTSWSTDKNQSTLLPFWQGIEFPFVARTQGYITHYPWNARFAGLWSTDTGEGPETQLTSSGGQWRDYAFMQGRGMQLVADLEEYLRAHKNPGSGTADESPANEDRLWRSDYRHLASHCRDGLVCQRNQDDRDGGYRFHCMAGVAADGACDSDPGTFGEGHNSCAPGLECFHGACTPMLDTGSACVTRDTGDHAHQRTPRCDWRHRQPQLACVPCPDDGELQRCEDGCLVDPETGDAVMYIRAYDNGCAKIHNRKMCRLVAEEATDRAYCDGLASMDH